LLHHHHIQPKYLIGKDNSPDNLTPPISVQLHSALHKDLYDHLGNTEDLRAYKMLLGESLSGIMETPEYRKKISVALKGIKKPPFSEAHKQNLSKSHKNLKHTKNQINKISISLLGNKRAIGNAKLWIIIFPDGSEKEILNLKQFCKENSLNPTHMSNVAQGKFKAHKGFKCLKVNDNDKVNKTNIIQGNI
jgi:hypothetical protein